MSNIKELLNATLTSNFKEHFDEIAQELLNLCVLNVNDKEMRICEIEFYLKSEHHDDIFAHCNEKQKENQTWYFHRTRDGTSYRGGTYKGLDITFGGNGFGGIIIRAISDDNTYIDGPCKVVDYILKECQVEDVKTLDSNLDNVFDKNLIYIKPKDLDEKEIYTSARFGLKFKQKEQSDFILLPYRYMSFPNKVRKGRQHLVLEMFLNGYSEQEIVKITGINKNVLSRYINDMKTGTEIDISEFIDTSMKVRDFSRFYGCLRN